MNRNLINLIIIIILGMTPLTWFKSGYIIAQIDYFPFWINSLQTSAYDLFLWNGINAGQKSAWPIYSIYSIVWFMLQRLSVPSNVIQILFEILFFMGAGLSMYFLAHIIYKNNKNISLIASIFYMFNFFMILRTLNMGISWVLCFLPTAMALYIINIDRLKSGKSITDSSIWFAIVLTVMSSFAAINPPLLIIIGLSIFLIFFWFILTCHGYQVAIFKNLIFLVCIILLLNLWWLIVFIDTYLINTDASNLPVSIDLLSYSWVHSRASFLNLFWLNGVWNWSPDYYTFFSAYQSNIFLLILLFVPMITMTYGILIKNNYEKINLYFASIVLTSMLISKGLHQPFQNLNLFIYEHMPGFSVVFREPFQKFYIILTIFLSLLLGCTIDSILERLKYNTTHTRLILSNAFMIIIIFSFILSTFPLINGDVIIKQGTRILPSAYISIPSYWIDASNFINNQDGDFKVLMAPRDPFYMVSYKWGYYGIDLFFASRLIVKPVLQNPDGYFINNKYFYVVNQIYQFHDVNELVGSIKNLNIRYILFRNDTNIDISNTNLNFINLLAKTRLVNTSKIFGKLYLYEINSSIYLPHIYAIANNIDHIHIPDYPKGAAQEEPFPNPNYMDIKDKMVQYEPNNKLHFNQDTKLNRSVPIIFQKINPTKYQVRIENASEPFSLVFSENYNSMWKLYIENTSLKYSEIISVHDRVGVKEARHSMKFNPLDIIYLLREPLPESHHFVAGGSSNAWYVNKTGCFDLTIIYLPQSIFYLSLGISIISFIACIIYVSTNMFANLISRIR